VGLSEGFLDDSGLERRHDDPDIVVAIPAYNEAGSIASVVAEAEPFADAVYVVDDGSEDETAERARGAGATVIEHGYNQGYGAALLSMFREVAPLEPDHLVVLDADGQHDPSDVPKLVRTQRETGSQIVIGNRYVGDATSDIPRYRRVGLWAVDLLTNLGFGAVRSDSRIGDTQSGFRAYSTEAIDELARSRDIGAGMGASTDILFHAKQRGYHIEEVGTSVDYDVEDGNTIDPLPHGLDLVRNIFTTVERRRPLTTLGFPGLLLLVGGTTSGYWQLSEYLRSGEFPLALAVVSTSLVVLGLLSCFTAMTLHALRTYFG
jgi:hypothetical protein